MREEELNSSKFIRLFIFLALWSCHIKDMKEDWAKGLRWLKLAVAVVLEYGWAAVGAGDELKVKVSRQNCCGCGES